MNPQLSLSAETGATSANTTPADASKNSLPDMGAPVQQGNTSVRPGPGGVSVESTYDRKKLIITPEYSNQTGLAISAAVASMLGDNAAIGVLLTAGSDKKEWLINAGFKVDERQHFIITAGQLKQFLDYAFRSGSEKVGMVQNSGGVSYQLQLGNEFLRFLEVNGYVSDTASRDLADKTFSVDTATLYELWNDPRRIAGGRVTGLQGRLGFSPLEGSTVKVSLGQERLAYDLFAGKDSVTRLTGGVEWLQQFGGGYQFKIGAESFASQNRYSIGLDRSLSGSEGGRHNLGLSLIGLRGRDGLGDDNQVKFSYTYTFGTASNSAGGRSAFSPRTNAQSNAAGGYAAAGSASGLLDQVAMRPSFIPSHVVAKVDNTALPTRLIAVDKTALPAGTSINAVTGDITAPLGVAVTGIAGVTRNLAAFANAGQFSLSGNSIVIRPSLIVQPAAGVVDTYVVTLNNQGGGTTLATVVVSHGSVKIDSITITAGATADVTPPVTTVAPTISVAATATTASVTQTINENGTGYWLLQPAAAAAPTVAAVRAGTAFAMSAGTPAVVSLTGLTASTAYKYYFVAKDTANNDQAAVSAALAITTTAAADVTPPVTTVAPTISIAATDTTASVTQTINENGTGYWLMQPAASAAPTVAAVKAGTAFAMTAGTPAVVSLSGLTASTAYKYYFVAKDTANNDQAAVSAALAITTTAAADVTPPPTPATLTLTGNGGASAGYTNALAITLAVADTFDAAPNGAVPVAGWFVSESSSAPAAAAGGWSSTKPTSFTVSAGDSTKNVYVYVKDTVGNVQPTGKTAAITVDATVPTISGLPNWAGGVVSSSTTATSVTFGDTAGGSPQAISVTANNGASITGFAGAYGVRSFNLVAPANNSAGPITVTISYSVTDNAGNVTTTTQNVSVAAAVPATPTGLNIAGGVLSWTAVAGAVSYNVDDVDLGGSIYTGAATSFNALIAGATSGETLSITATNAFGITSAAATIVVP